MIRDLIKRLRTSVMGEKHPSETVAWDVADRLEQLFAPEESDLPADVAAGRNIVAARAVAASYLDAWQSTKAKLQAAEREVEIGKGMLGEAMATIAELQAEIERLKR